MSSPSEPLLDLLIVGGGLSGLTLLHRLRQLCPDRQLLLVEQPERLAAAERDPRLLALARHSQQLLQQWQLWPQLAADVSPIHSIEVSDQGHAGRLLLRDDSAQPFGHVVEAAALSRALKTASLPVRGATIGNIEQQADLIRVTLASGETIACRLLVLADGGSQRWDQALGQQRSAIPYANQALIALVESDRPHGGRAFERFTTAGPLALLPVGERQFSLVWCGTEADCQSRLQAAPEHFNRLLQQAVGYRAGELQLVAERNVYPLALMQVARLMGHRCLWLGNAAHTLHPVAGQGFNLALRDIDCLCRLLAASPIADWGRYPLLADYERQREGDIAATVRFTDGLLALFANDHASLVVGRNLALAVLNLLPVGQRLITRQGMGLGNH